MTLLLFVHPSITFLRWWEKGGSDWDQVQGGLRLDEHTAGIGIPKVRQEEYESLQFDEEGRNQEVREGAEVEDEDDDDELDGTDYLELLEEDKRGGADLAGGVMRRQALLREEGMTERGEEEEEEEAEEEDELEDGWPRGRSGTSNVTVRGSGGPGSIFPSAVALMEAVAARAAAAAEPLARWVVKCSGRMARWLRGGFSWLRQFFS